MAIVQAAIHAARADVLVRRTLALGLPWGEETDVTIVAVGKAAPPMAAAAVAALGASVRGGLVVGPHDMPVPAPLVWLRGEHPEPGAGSEAAGRRALEVAASVPKDGHLLVLLSGGASSLMVAPAPGVSAADTRQTAAMLMRAGADIFALNTVRKHLSRVKGGWLAAAASSSVTTWAISDVIGDDLSVIGSGPTVPDPSTFEDAHAVLTRFGGVAQYPRAVVAHLEAGLRGDALETPKPGDVRLARSTASVIGGRCDAMQGAEQEAQMRGYHTLVLDSPLQGEAREAGRRHVAHVLGAVARDKRLPRPLCVVSSGETTVTVRGPGRGGRNQELALAAAEVMAAFGVSAVLASAGTDGVDGPTDAAGALADSTTLARAAGAGVGRSGAFLDRNDSYSFFAATGDLIHTGPTGTNVGDLQVILLA